MEVLVTPHPNRLHAILQRAKSHAEAQLEALRAEHFAVFKLLPDGDCLDWTAEHIKALEDLAHELEEAIRRASNQPTTLDRSARKKLSS